MPCQGVSEDAASSSSQARARAPTFSFHSRRSAERNPTHLLEEGVCAQFGLEEDAQGFHLQRQSVEALGLKYKPSAGRQPQYPCVPQNTPDAQGIRTSCPFSLPSTLLSSSLVMDLP